MAGINLNFDWDGLNYSALNGFHPLFNFFIRKNEGVTELKYKVYEFMEKTYYYEKFEPEYLKTLTNIRELNANDINFNLTWNFFDIDEQFLTEILAKDIYFCHTFPLSIGIRDFIFHLEDIKSLFIPLEDFYAKSVNELHGSKFFIGYVKYLEKILSSDKCLSILCHYQETADELVKLFTHDSVEKKIKMLNIVSLHRENTPKKEQNIVYTFLSWKPRHHQK